MDGLGSSIPHPGHSPWASTWLFGLLQPMFEPRIAGYRVAGQEIHMVSLTGRTPVD